MKVERFWEAAFRVFGVCFVGAGAAYFALPEGSKLRAIVAFGAASCAVLCLSAAALARKSERVERAYEVNDLRREIARKEDADGDMDD
jgi:hypothetical protein